MMNNKALAGIVVAVGVVIIAVVLWSRPVAVMQPTTPPASGNDVACTMEAKLCPDGSAVGRMPPTCEFAACPTVATSTSAVTTTPLAPVVPIGWKTATDTAQGMSFAYPATIGTNYISTTDWPPKISLSKNTPFNCVAAGSEIAPAGQTTQTAINGHEYCISRESDGAAGSIYTQYAYAFPKGADLAIMSFSLRAVQCGNYDEPKKQECEQERASFDPNQLADQIAQTVR